MHEVLVDEVVDSGHVDGFCAGARAVVRGVEDEFPSSLDVGVEVTLHGTAGQRLSDDLAGGQVELAPEEVGLGVRVFQEADAVRHRRAEQAFQQFVPHDRYASRPLQ